MSKVGKFLNDFVLNLMTMLWFVVLLLLPATAILFLIKGIFFCLGIGV